MRQRVNSGERFRRGNATAQDNCRRAVRQRWAPYVLPGGKIDRRYYELCVLSELRDRLRAGEVWVVGSRQYRSFEERLISTETLRELEAAGTLPIAVEADFEEFIAARQTLLDCQSALNSFQVTAPKSFQLIRPVSAVFCAV